MVPDGWDELGQPVGRPWGSLRTPWVQLAATSEDQSRNSWAPLLEMLRGGSAVDEYPGLEPLDSFVNLPKGRIEAVTAAAASREGNRPVFCVLDQALELGTVIPTPGGWTTMGDLEVGDTVFGSDGRPVKVVQAKPVSTEHDCFQITFVDGTSVIASDGHRWMTKLAGSPAEPRVRTTGEMYRDGQCGLHATRAQRRELIESALLRDPSRSNDALAYEFGANRKTVAAARSRLAAGGAAVLTERRGGGSAKLARYREPVAVVGSAEARRFMVPTAPARVMPETDLSAPPYLLGLWLGDGTRGKCEIAVSEGDLLAVQANLAAIGVETWPRRYAPTGKGYAGGHAAVNLTFSRVAGYQGADRPEAAKALSALGCYRDKYVPEKYLSGSIQQRTELLQGLMDSDGCCTEAGPCTFVSTSHLLADAVTTLLRSLGQVTSGPKWSADTRYTDGGKYRVDFTARGGLLPFQLPRKAARVRQHRRTPGWTAVTSIEPVPRVPVRCIEVDSEDHLFAFGEAGHLTHNTEAWTVTNGGVKLAATLRRNLGKTGGSSVESPNAFIPGLGSVAEASAEYFYRIAEGRARDDGLLWDHREAPPDTDLGDRESLLRGLAVAYGESAESAGGWVNLDRLVAEIWDPATDPQDARAYYLGQITHASDAWLTHIEWVGCADATKDLADKDMVTLGFDGSVREDSTALVACRVEDGHLELLGCWEKPDGLAGDGWQVDRVEVDAAVFRAFERFKVVGMYADPAFWQDALDRWTTEFAARLLVQASQQRPLEYWTNRPKPMVDALERFHDAVASQHLTHDGNSVLTRHVLNARRRIGRSGVTIAKEAPSSGRKIDAAMAAVLAYECRGDAVAKGLARLRRTRRAVGF